MSPFRFAIIVACAGLLVVAMLLFSGVLPGFRSKSIGAAGTVVFWGTVPTIQMGDFVTDMNRQYDQQFKLTYVAKDPRTIKTELVDALARGEGPDIVLLSHEELLNQEDKFLTIPHATFSEQAFDQTFIPQASLLKRDLGFVALPWYVDPLVLYYNDSIMTSAGVAVPPTTWLEVKNPLSTGFLKKVTQVDERNNIKQSAIALGQFDNVNHAKDILALLIMQAGDPIVAGRPGNLDLGLGAPANAALNFFIQFSDPTKEEYTWNSALPQAIDMFASGKLALYVGAASDLARLRALNPHFEPRVTFVPQGDRQLTQTFGRMYVLAVPKAAKRPAAAVSAAIALTGSAGTKAIIAKVALPPARRDLIAVGTIDPYQSLFYQSALISRSWFDLDAQASAKTFRTMLTSVLSGTENITKAVGRAANELLLNK